MFMQTIIHIAVLSALLMGVVALLFKRWPAVAKFFSFVLCGISGLAAAVAGLSTLISTNIITFQINSGFLDFIWQFKLDGLSGFFLAIVGLVVTCVAVYAPGYMCDYEKQRPITGMTFFTGLFIAGMYLVILANDIFSFMLAWELMSISSYFLVAYHHEHTENRNAAFIYLIMAHLSGLFILFGFGILAKFGNGFSFAAMQTANLTPIYANLAILFALIGFGMKAGIVPLHIWLPRAHPVAPSHISALMSGVMLKVAVYGFLRFYFSLIGKMNWQWGVIILIVGTVSALLGVLYALMQHDLKKLLAYHSVENIGIIFIGIGLSIIFLSTGHPVLGALGLIAALYHCLNHALFKSLLFLGAGAILQNSHENDLENMGGLIRKMPYTALFFLIGCISISALPPFNGFVSEWLTFQTALQAPTLTSEILRTIVPVAAAILALTGALAAGCFVKVYGVAFLGQARTSHVDKAKDPDYGMRLAMGLLAIFCLLFGILPTTVVNIINIIPNQLLGASLATTHNFLWLIPLSSTIASYNAPLILIYILILWFLCYLFLHINRQRKIKFGKVWECGFGGINSRMQYSATAFAMPIRRVFKGVWPVKETVEKSGNKINYTLKVGDWIWQFCYEPLENFMLAISRVAARLQSGNIRLYLAYIFFTLILLLWIIA
jgi:formate hydrogenlyase subunit 3/multisubunit Na+/H+ antiporter MnhD subunit